MKKFIKKIINNKILMAFLLSTLLGSFIIVPEIILGDGIYNITDDFNLQQIPFNEFISSSIKSGNIFWNSVSDLGSNFIGTFSFYNLFSIFNIIGYLFPVRLFPYLIGPIFILKYGVAGLTSYLYFKRYVKNKNYAVIGSLLYAFSGFQLTNILFYHFHDIVALFPLLLYTFDNLIYDNKRGRFCLTVALMLFTNWFFFIGQVIFVIIYYLVKIFTKEIKFEIKKFLQIFFESLIGVGMASVIIIPTLLFTMGNPRINGSWSLINMFKYYNWSMYFEIIRAFILPPEVMNSKSIINQYNYSSVEIFLPFIGIVYSISYIIKNRKNWESIFVILLVIMAFVPILNNSFFAFTTMYYARWFYMLILFLSLTSIKAMENRVQIKYGIVFTILMYIILVLFLYLYSIKNNMVVIFDKKYFAFASLILIFSLIIMMKINCIKNINKFLICIICMIFLYTTVWGNYMLYKYKGNTFEMNDSYRAFLNSYKNLDLKNDVRINGDASCLYNFGYINNFSYLKSFNTNINPSNFKFYNSIGLDRGVETNISPETEKDLNDFLSVKYIMSCDKSNNLEDYGYKFYKNMGEYNIYLNNNYLNFGFSVNSYLPKKDFFKLSKEDRKKIIKTNIILTKNQIEKYSYLYKNKSDIKYKSSSFKYIKNGFESNIESEKETLSIFTIPYDKGWKATINGKKVLIENVDNGLMAVKINSGKNKIVFKYVPSGLKIGAIISIVSVLIYIWYVIMIKKEKLV